MHITVTPPSIATLNAAARLGPADFPAIFGGGDTSPTSPQVNPMLDDGGLPDESDMDDDMQDDDDLEDDDDADDDDPDDDDPDDEEQEDFEPGDEIEPDAPDEISDASEPEIDLPLHDLQEH